MADDFKIKIVTEGDSRGADRVADSLGKVTRAANDNTKAAAQTSRGMNELGEASEKGAAVGRVFGQVMSGNVAALAQIGAALKATGAALKTNIVGVLLISGTALWSFFQNLRRETSATGEAAKESAEDFNEQRAAIEKLNQVRLDALKTQLEGISSATKAALDHATQLDAATRKIQDARMNLELAEVGADKTLTPAQRAAREFEIRQRYADSSSQREAAAQENRVAVLQQDAEEKARLADQTERARDQQAGLVGATSARRTGLNTAMQQLNAQFLAALSSAGRDEATKRALAEEYQARSSALAVSQGVAFGPAAEARFGAMQARLTGFESEAGVARGAATTSEAALLAARQAAGIDAYQRPVTRGLERAAARAAMGIPEPVSDRGSLSQIVESGATSISVKGRNGEDIGKRIADSVEQRVKAGEEAIARAVEQRMKQIEQQMKSQRTK